MTSGGVFSETLQSITTTKLTELSKKRKVFEDRRIALLAATDSEVDQRKKLCILVDGVKTCFSIKTTVQKKGDRYGQAGRVIRTGSQPELEVFLKNLERFLTQAQYDPSISAKTLQGWEKSLKKQLDVQSLKYQFATLYGELVTEWLTEEQNRSGTPPVSDDFEYVRRETQARDEARGNWERLVFEPAVTDEGAIADYLRTLFGSNGTNKMTIKALEALRRSVEDFESSLANPDQFNEPVLRWTITGLIASNLLPEAKSAALKDFLSNLVILLEVADVLNMRIAALDTWQWDEEGLPVMQRRHVTGKHHIYIEEDLLQAIFLQYVGVKWSVFFKQAILDFSCAEGAWVSLREPLSHTDNARRKTFFPNAQLKPSVQSKRQGLHRSVYFMSLLPNFEEEQWSALDGEEEVEFDTKPHDVLQDFDFDSFQDSTPKPAPIQKKQREFSSTQPKASHPMSIKSDRTPATLAPYTPVSTHSVHQQQQTGNHALQSYQLQLMMLEQQNKKRLMMARQEQGGDNNAMPGYYNANQMSHSKHQQIARDNHRSDFNEYDFEDEADKPKSRMQTKQFLLHLLSAEILVNTKLKGEFTCVHSEFEAWSPSLPHSTITSVLSFFGVSSKWLKFFRSFLEAPLKFVEDGESAETRVRKRGVPASHSLSVVCGEIVLFCLDYSVNQRTNGAQLHRLHDDFWIWSSNHQTVVDAWKAITQFKDIMGVSLNASKTGSVRIMSDKAKPQGLDRSLPRGDIRWGFLYLDPVTGRFIIDDSMLDKHIDELRRQMQDKKSIFAWIQAWNTYAGRFFISNFGKPANCFGREHLDAMLKSLERIQRSIFGATSVVEYLKKTIHERFGVSDIPDGYLYLPASLGGLELHNSFIGLIQQRDSLYERPETALDDFLENEADEYRRSKIQYETNQSTLHMTHTMNPHISGSLPANMPYMSLEEFGSAREELRFDYEGNLYSVFMELLKQPTAETVEFGTVAELELMSYPDLTDDYWRWIVQLYGSDMVERFGGLKIVDTGLLPIGMVNLFREGKVKWQG